MKHRIIAISGWRGVGKDMLGIQLCRHFKYTRYAFADVLKNFCATKYNLPRQIFDHRIQKDKCQPKHSQTPRQMCITEAKRIRKLDNNYFVKALVEKMKQDKVARVVVTDWRYVNEVLLLEGVFGSENVLKVRVDWPNDGSIPIAAPTSNETEEHYLDNADFDIVLLPSHRIEDIEALLPERFQ